MAAFSRRIPGGPSGSTKPGSRTRLQLQVDRAFRFGDNRKRGTMSNNTVETLVGAIVIAIAGAFFFYVYTSTNKSVGSGGYHVSAEFDNVGTVNVGTDVRVAGIKVGTVTGQDLNPERSEEPR